VLDDREMDKQAASAAGLRDGYRAHVAACPETGVITGEELPRPRVRKQHDRL
jgi:hypothetical protein